MRRTPDPWSDVEHIDAQTKADGSIIWTLTLSCGHTAVRYGGNPTTSVFRARPRLAPARVRCILCGTED